MLSNEKYDCWNTQKGYTLRDGWKGSGWIAKQKESAKW
jgi:hypothetical protein